MAARPSASLVGDRSGRRSRLRNPSGEKTFGRKALRLASSFAVRGREASEPAAAGGEAESVVDARARPARRGRDVICLIGRPKASPDASGHSQCSRGSAACIGAGRLAPRHLWCMSPRVRRPCHRARQRPPRLSHRRPLSSPRRPRPRQAPEDEWDAGDDDENRRCRRSRRRSRHRWLDDERGRSRLAVPMTFL